MADDKKIDANDKKSSPTGTVTGEELEKRCIKYAMYGLISCGLESTKAYANICKSSGTAGGDYPSMGFQGWEGINGGNGDTLLIKLGLSQYANKTWTELESAGAIETIRAKLDSEEGHKVQLEMGSQTQANYLSILKQNGWTVSGDGKSTVFVLMWMGCGPNALAPMLKNSSNLDLDGIYQWFSNNWMGKAGESCREGYINRNNKTYAYCKQINMAEDPNPNMIVDLSAAAGSGLGYGSVGYGFEVKAAGKDTVKITKLPKGKTSPCEPIYPDLVTVSDTVPQWILDATIVAVNKQAEEEVKAKSSK